MISTWHHRQSIPTRPATQQKKSKGKAAMNLRVENDFNLASQTVHTNKAGHSQNRCQCRDVHQADAPHSKSWEHVHARTLASAMSSGWICKHTLMHASHVKAGPVCDAGNRWLGWDDCCNSPKLPRTHRPADPRDQSRFLMPLLDE